MGTKKQNERIEAVRDAATGYGAVVLGIVCFLLALTIVVAGVRVVVGASASSNAAATATAAISDANASGSETA